MTVWQPIDTAPREPIRTSPQSPWFQGEEHGPVIQLKFSDFRDGRDVYQKWHTQIGWWQPSDAETGSWRFLEDDGPGDVQPAFWAPLLDRNAT
jgi:hypothetical protein